jgi:tRNA pseudouridine55 synthase
MLRVAATPALTLTPSPADFHPSMSKPRSPRRPVSGILLLDKPLGISSNTALQIVKRLYQAEKAGHTGSLDPLATGMLPVCLGEATKLSGVLLDSDKTYRAELKLGVRTSTGDAEGAVVETGALPSIDALHAAAAGLVGAIEQTPPMYSALKHEGQRLYTLARQGIEVERRPRRVVIHDLRIEVISADRVALLVRCSKGTYIRTLAEDLARAAGSCAHLIGLRRTAVAPFDDQSPVPLERLEALAADGGLQALDALLLSPADGLRHWPQVRVDEQQARLLARGRPVEVQGIRAGARVAVLDESGALLGLGEGTATGLLAPRRWLAVGSE